MGRRLQGPVRIGKNPVWFARLTLPHSQRDHARRLGVGYRFTRSLRTRDHRVAMQRWPEAYQQLQREVSARLREEPIPVRGLVDQALEEVVITRDGVHRPEEFFAPDELATVITGQRSGRRHTEALLVLSGGTSWEDLMERRSQRALQGQGRPLSPSWCTNASLAIRRALEAGLGVPEEVTRSSVRRLMEGMSCSPVTRSKLLSILSGLIQTGLEEDLLDMEANPFRQVSFAAVAPDGNRRRGFTTNELDLLFSSSLGLWFQVLTATGLRVGELLSRDKDHIQDQILVIEATPTWRPKNRSSIRRVPLPLELVPEVRRLLPVSKPSAMTQRLQREVRSLFPEDRRLVVHSCRHTFTTLARQAAVPFEVLQALLGHSGGGQTRGYGCVPDAVLVEAVERVYGQLK